MSRFKQEMRSLPPSKAVSAAIPRTGGVISSAGLILAAAFAVLMTRPIRELFQLGFAMAFGILLDTFLVRPLLVRAVVRLLGDRARWPTSPVTHTPRGPFRARRRHSWGSASTGHMNNRVRRTRGPVRSRG